MSEARTSETRNTYKCLWRTVSTYDGARQCGEITVEARSLSHAIDVAKQKIYEQHHLGTKNVVIYEVEEPFL